MNVLDLELGSTEFRLIGDPHQGRQYRHGVMPHRRGEREKMNRKALEDALLEIPAGVEFVVIMGDIFDQFIVDPSTVLFVAMLLRTAAYENLDIMFVTLRGNHDASRDADKRSSFDLLVELLRDVENLFFAKEEPLEMESGEGEQFLFLPWHPFITAAQMADSTQDREYVAVFGHWDIEDFGGDNHNLIPLEELSAITDLVITGHVHQRQTFEREGVKVIVTGSLLPQAHGEDLEGDLFVTTSLEDFDAEAMRDMCVRIRLKPSEELPADIDVLQLVVQRVNEEEEEVDLAQVEMAGFDLKTLWETSAAENGVKLPLMNEIWGFLSTELEAQG